MQNWDFWEKIVLIFDDNWERCYEFTQPPSQFHVKMTTLNGGQENFWQSIPLKPSLWYVTERAKSFLGNVASASKDTMVSQICE